MSDAISFEEYLNENDMLTYTNIGTSMMPLLREGKDLFIVRKKGGERCRKGDVVLYKRPPNKYVLHRIIDVQNDGYIIMGDNTVSKEYGIKDEDILGIMTGYVREGKQHSTEDVAYRLYSAVIMNTVEIRVFIKKLGMSIVRYLKQVIHGK